MRRYTSAYHRGSLKDCLSTEKTISFLTFQKLIKSKLYHFYAYDERIKANRYIIYEIPGNLGMPTWLFEYEEKK